MGVDRSLAGNGETPREKRGRGKARGTGVEKAKQKHHRRFETNEGWLFSFRPCSLCFFARALGKLWGTTHLTSREAGVKQQSACVRERGTLFFMPAQWRGETARCLRGFLPSRSLSCSLSFAFQSCALK